MAITLKAISESNASMGRPSPRRRVLFAPTVAKFPKAKKLMLDCVRDLISVAAGASATSNVRQRVFNLAKGLGPDFATEVSCCASILCDLRMHGWDLMLEGTEIFAVEAAAAEDPGKRKSQVRDVLLIERDIQLAESPVRRFIQAMERPRIRGGEWKSVFSLMRDGRDLAIELEAALEEPIGEQRLDRLRTCIDPYLQIIEAHEKCEFTGLRLMDIWRYFRYTWSIPYNSTPGRKVFALVRDRAAKNHPIIGIGALGSAIVQLGDRDRWIGWTSDQVLAAMRESPNDKWSRWVASSLSTLIGSVRSSDVCRKAGIGAKQLRMPTRAGVNRLRLVASQARDLHRLYPQRARHKASGAHTKSDWLNESRTHLFRGKRATALAELLEARRRLIAAGFTGRATGKKLQTALESREAAQAIATILRYKKATSVGVNMMDITVCGAVAPYNLLLGGKLVSLLMASPELVAAYNRRYKRATSLIASGMAGRPVRRRPKLVLLCTTSLYDVAPSQYNRLRMPIASLGGRIGEHLTFTELGVTEGYGSYHFSKRTRELLEAVVARTRSGRVVNSIFGEGVNPKFRKLRGALDALGLPADELLQHGSPRRIYGVPLAENFREVLLGLSSTPDYIVEPATSGVPQIAEYWRERWLQKRVERSETLNGVICHSLVYPIRHGARVPVIPYPQDDWTLFSDEWPA